MKKPITITLTSAMEGVSERELRILLMDALGEFHLRRTPSFDYVRKRHSHLAEGRRIEKCWEVERRCDIAKSIQVALKTESPLVLLARCSEDED